MFLIIKKNVAHEMRCWYSFRFSNYCTREPNQLLANNLKLKEPMPFHFSMSYWHSFGCCHGGGGPVESIIEGLRCLDARNHLPKY